MQISLFAPEETPLPPKADAHAGVDMEALRNLAFLYTATETGTNSGIRFMMTLEDAQAWCELPISRGRHYETEWAYFYTSVANFVTCYWCGRAPAIDLTGAADDGSWDERIAAHGFKKISIWDFEKVLRPLGVAVENVPSKIINDIMADRARKAA